MDVSWYLAAYLETLRRARRAVAEHLGVPDGPGAVHALVRSVNVGERAAAGWASGVGYRVDGVACRLDVPGSGMLDLDVTAGGNEVFDALRVQSFIGAIPAVPPAEAVISEALAVLVGSGELVAAEAHRYALPPAPGPATPDAAGAGAAGELGPAGARPAPGAGLAGAHPAPSHPAPAPSPAP